jgi:hypothetical protein
MFLFSQSQSKFLSQKSCIMLQVQTHGFLLVTQNLCFWEASFSSSCDLMNLQKIICFSSGQVSKCFLKLQTYSQYSNRCAAFLSHFKENIIIFQCFIIQILFFQIILLLGFIAKRYNYSNTVWFLNSNHIQNIFSNQRIQEWNILHAWILSITFFPRQMFGDCGIFQKVFLNSA